MKRYTVVGILLGVMLAAAEPAFAQFGLGAARRGLNARNQIADLVLTEEEEREIGTRIVTRLRARFGVVQSEPLHKYVSMVGLLAAQRSERPLLKWSFTVLDTEGVNAFAAPGGFVFVTRGLLGLLQNEAELMAVLAHEVGHIAHRHSVNALRKSKGIEVANDLVVEDRSQLLGVVTDKVYSSVLENAFDRGDEIDSDRQSVAITGGLKYQPDALGAFLDQLWARNKQQAGNSGKRNGLFASHPDMEARLSVIRELTKGAPKGTLMRERFVANAGFTVRPLGDLAIVEAPPGTPAQPAPEAEKAKEKEKRGFLGRTRDAARSVVNRGQATPRPEQEQAVIDSGGTRGVDADRYATGGPDKTGVDVTVTPDDLDVFAKQIR
jgi:beta-barrel assembly-enhancing protease